MTAPKLLFDENLSARLIRLLAEIYPGSAHVDAVGLHGCTDHDVWEHARNHDFVLVSKDNDFRQLSFLHGAPPKVIWLRLGNSPTSAVVELLLSHRANIESFVSDPETALLPIPADCDYP